MRKIVAVLGLILLITLGYLALSSLEKPTVTVDSIEVREISEKSVIVDVRVIIHNPNPISAEISRINFDVYYFEDGTQKYLGHGEKESVRIRKKGNTTLTIPLTIDNFALIRAFIEAISEESITLKVSGSAYLDLKLFEVEIPFEKTQRVEFEESETQTLEAPLAPVPASLTPSPELRPSLAPTLTSAPIPTPSSTPSPSPSLTPTPTQTLIAPIPSSELPGYLPKVPGLP